MKKSILVVALAVVLVFALAATALATSAKTWNYQADYYSWGSVSGNGIPSVTNTNTLGEGGTITTATAPVLNSNPANPGVHAGYTTTTAKCGICHSVHRAKSGGVKLLNTATATCAGCHVSGTSTVTNVVIAWGTIAAPLAGPHDSSGSKGATSCTDKACHATSPHGANGSAYGLFASKLLTAAVDAAVSAAAANPTSSGVTAALLTGAGQSTNFTGDSDAVRVGYTCNSAGCHEQTMLPVISAGWSEQRETVYPLGVTIAKTGHMTGALPMGTVAYAPVASCVSCHDQVDATTRSGHTFPHAQRATGAGSGQQTYLWYNISDTTTGTLDPMINSNMKSFDGACLKCHRTGTAGVGITF